MRIVQITDLHISPEGEKPHGVDVRNQFLEVVRACAALHPDWVVLSGDLCFRDPSDEVYGWIAEQVRIFSCPVAVMAGNHDSQGVMHRHFMCEYHPDTEEIYCSQVWHGIPVLFLDTARGFMSESQHQWLEGHLITQPRHVVLFIHHPPSYCGVPYMDMNYAFQEIPRLQQLFQASRAAFQIFCGHYHVERTISFANQQIHITPSTFFQIDSTQVEFKIDHRRPGYRLIELNAEGIYRNTCHYL